MDILDLEGKKIGTIKLPNQFNEEYRPDLIKKAVLSLQSKRRQKYGRNSEAGKRYSSTLSRRRRKYRGAYGHGVSRSPRKIMVRRGTQLIWEGATAPNTRGGGRAHPPKAEKSFVKEINNKERRKAIRSAVSATINKELVEKRGHKIKNFPLIISSDVENLSKTKDVKNLLIKLGLDDELKRIEIRKIRAGKGKNRGRKYRIKKGPLFVVSENCKLNKSARNILGIDIKKVNLLNAELLAPGCSAGRLTIWSDKAIKKMGEESLFIDKNGNL